MKGLFHEIKIFQIVNFGEVMSNAKLSWYWSEIPVPRQQ